MTTRKYFQPKATDSLYANIKRIYGNAELAADQLQFFIVALVREAESMSKKDIKDPTTDLGKALEHLFKNAPRGMDRGTLSAWFVKFTPMRPKFNKGNGHYEGIGFANKNPTWDIEGATNTHWTSVDPEATRKVQVPKLDKQIEGLMIQAAKIAAVSDVSIAELAQAIQAAAKKAEDTIRNNMESERVVNFVEQFANATVH